MQKKKIYILLGHPNTETLTGAFADAYETGALDAGHEVRRQNIGEMKFDPILHKGYKEIQELEPDLITFQENMKWAEHIVILYPNWWCSMPALLKGLFDRAWLPGFAFKFGKNGLMGKIMWKKLFKGKSARVIICANTPAFVTHFLFGDFTNELSHATLGFAGIKPVRVKVFSPTEEAPNALRLRWIRMVKHMGRKAK